MLANFNMYGNILVLRSFKHGREECESKWAYVFQVPDVLFVRTL